MSKKNEKDRPGHHLIFVASLRTRSGKKIYASAYGLRGFPIWVKD